MDEKKYYKGLAYNDEDSIEGRRVKRQDKFMKDRQGMNNQSIDVMDDTLQNKTNKVVTPEFREAKVDAYRKARRAMKGLPVDEVTDTIDMGDYKRQMMKMGKGLGKGMRRGLKSIPIIGSLAAAIMSQDASAGVPILDQAESLGPEQGSLDAKLEDGTITPEERAQLRQQALANMLK